MSKYIITICPECRTGMKYSPDQETKVCTSCGKSTVVNKLRVIEKAETNEQAQIYIGEVNKDTMRGSDSDFGFNTVEQLTENDTDDTEAKLKGVKPGMSKIQRFDEILSRTTPAPRDEIIVEMVNYGFDEREAGKLLDKKHHAGIVMDTGNEIVMV